MEDGATQAHEPILIDHGIIGLLEPHPVWRTVMPIAPINPLPIPLH